MKQNNSAAKYTDNVGKMKLRLTFSLEKQKTYLLRARDHYHPRLGPKTDT